MTYPLTLTREALVERGACYNGVEAFDAIAPDGILVITDVAAHVALLSSPLAEYEAWAIGAEILPPIQATAGDDGTATAGYRGTATAGDDGTASVGHRGTASAGNYGTATAGYRGTATAGDDGTATAGHGGTATAGNYGTATAGDDGTATAGCGGELRLRWWDAAARRYRTSVAYVGEDEILPDVPYRLDTTTTPPTFVPAQETP